MSPRKAVVVVVALVSLLTARVWAHSGGASFVELAPLNDGWRAVIDLPLPELAAELSLDANSDSELRWGEVLQAMPRILQTLRLRLAVSDLSGHCQNPLQWQPDADPLLAYRDSGVHLRLLANVACPVDAGARGRIDLRVDVRRWLQESPEHGVYLTRNDQPDRLTLLTGSHVATTVMADRSGPEPSRFVAFLNLGIEHMLTGYDHLAFLGLLLLGLTAAWRQSQATWQKRLREAVGLLTAFTLAHSLTLALAAAGWLRLPAAPVEIAIAGSIVLAAVAVLRGWRPMLGRRAAFVFGLIHGLGFANMLATQLQGVDLALPLLAFNVGLELAQLAVVLVSLPVLALLLRWPDGSYRLTPVAAAAIGLSGTWWLWERL